MGKTSGVLWPRFSPQVLVQPVGDLGELAARLASLVTYSRSGTVMFADGFEDGLSPYDYAVSAGIRTTTLETSISYRGANSAKLWCADDSGNVANVRKYIPLYRTGKMGIEIHFRFETGKEIIRVWVFKLEDLEFQKAQVLIDTDAGKVYYFHEGGSQVEIDDLDLTLGLHNSWHAVKLFADMENKAYIKLWIDDNEYDLENIALWTGGIAGLDQLQTGVSLFRSGANACTMYVDDFIITIDEN